MKTPNDTLHELAEALRDLFRHASEHDPTDASMDVACALVVELSRRGLVVSHVGHEAAAERTFVALTEWLRANPEGRCTAVFGRATEQFHVTVSSPHKTSSFEGLDAQDAYAKAAQAILFGAFEPEARTPA